MKGRFLNSRQETVTLDTLEQANLLPESRPESNQVSIPTILTIMGKETAITLIQKILYQRSEHAFKRKPR